MSQNDFSIANQGFPSFRADLNSALQAVASNSGGLTAPATTYAYQWWYDSTNDLLMMRNADNDAWIEVAALNQTDDKWEVRTGVIQAESDDGLSIKTTDEIERIFVDGTIGDTLGDVTVTNRLIVNQSAYAATNTVTTNTGSVTLDFDAYQNFVLTLTGNVTLANPTTGDVGQTGFIVVMQDATGGRTLSLGTDFETVGGGGITLSSDPTRTDVIPYMFIAANRILLGAPQLAFS